MTTNQQLRELIYQSGITRKEAAELACVSVHAINKWLEPESSKNYRKCPPQIVELLELKLGFRNP